MLKMIHMNKRNILVIGAGPGGLAAAWNLVHEGHSVIVLEKETYYGGASTTFEKDGSRYDLGPHNLHPHRDSIIDFLERNFHESLMYISLTGDVFFRNKRFQYPLEGKQVFTSLSLFTSIKCGLSLLWIRLLLFLNIRTHDDGTYKTWVVDRFGKQFYDIFFGPYTEKVWGIPASELSDVVAKKRIAVKGLTDLIRQVIFKQKESDHPEHPKNVKKYYIRHGVGEISNFFASEICQHGGTILTGCTVDKVVLNGKRVCQVQYTQDNEHKTLDLETGQNLERWEVLSTIPVNDFILMLDGDVSPEVVESAHGLDFTSEVFLYLNLNRADVLKTSLLFFSENEFRCNRVYDVGAFSREMVPPGKTALCVEFTCSYGDDIWNAADEKIFELCLVPMEKNNLLSRADVESYHTRRLKHAYPRFRVGYQEKLRTIFNYLETLENFETFGRQGLFSYANIDDVIWMAFQVTKHIPYKDRLSLPIKELLPEYVDW
jgi:protoporphyrinogen oxidase